MRSRSAWLIGALCIGVPAFFLLPVLWPQVADAPEPGTAAGVLWTVAAFAKALAFGFGAVFLVFGFPFVRRAEYVKAWAVPLHLSIAWLLLSWLPIAALHGAPERAGEASTALLALHLTVIAATAVVAQRFLTLAGARPQAHTRSGA